MFTENIGTVVWIQFQGLPRKDRTWNYTQYMYIFLVSCPKNQNSAIDNIRIFPMESLNNNTTALQATSFVNLWFSDFSDRNQKQDSTPYLFYSSEK